MGSLSLISLNIERSKHLDRVVPFLQKEKPDVFCVQELSERDIAVFEALFPYRTSFVPFSLFDIPGEPISSQGACIFARIPLIETEVKYYVGPAEKLPATILGITSSYEKGDRAVLFATVENGGAAYRIGTTHFTWSERGEASATQREHLDALLKVLEEEKEFVLCGDFNMPRGGELFGLLAEKYKDNIPPEYKTSIDLTLHRNRDIDTEELSQKMVDGLFTTPHYRASDVRLVPGVSDHMAIVATVEKS